MTLLRTSTPVKNPHTLSDQELAHALLGSHRDAEVAFTELYGRYSQRTYAYLLRMTGDGAASQDLLQDSFLKFYAAARQDLLVANPGGFILMTARNLCLNWVRDRRAVDPIEGLDFAFHEQEQHERNDLLRLLNLA